LNEKIRNRVALTIALLVLALLYTLNYTQRVLGEPLFQKTKPLIKWIGDVINPLPQSVFDPKTQELLIYDDEMKILDFY
jgi:hypothetical protein